MGFFFNNGKEDINIKRMYFECTYLQSLLLILFVVVVFVDEMKWEEINQGENIKKATTNKNYNKNNYNRIATSV